MEKLRTILAAGLVALSCNAYSRVVYDWQCVKQVEANAAAASAIEEEQNHQQERIQKNKVKIAELTASMEAIKELYHMTMTNVKGFGAESALYKGIFELTSEICVDLPKVTSTILKHPGKNVVLCMNEMADVAFEVEGLVHSFIDIVNNGKVGVPDDSKLASYIPKSGGRFKLKSGDGYNFIDRATRYQMANNVYSRLYEIRLRMQAMAALCAWCTGSDAFFAIDPESWAAAMTGYSIATSLIDDWKRLI